MNKLWTMLVLVVAVIAVMAYVEGQRPDVDGSTTTKAASGGVSETHAAEDVNSIAVVARGVTVVPGAIVCPDFPTFKLMFSLYTESWSENAQNKMTKGLSSAIEGPPTPEPDFESHGCALLPSGNPMRLENSDAAWSVVTAKLPNGKTIRGVTLPSMTDYPPEVRKQRQELEQAQGQRYDEIMQPEIERHAAAIKQEHDRHLAIMRQLNPRYIEVPPESGVDCIEANCQEESRRYADTVRQENALFLSRSHDARRQAAQPQPAEQ